MNIFELNELKQFARTNTYQAHGDPQAAECIIGFSFGYLATDLMITPGRSNEALARFIEERLSEKPLLVQFEIADAFKKRTTALTIRKHRQAGKYLSSDEVAAQALGYMKTQGWTSAIIVTHPAMEARNDYMCTGMGIVTVTPLGLENVPYEPESAQAWTRDPASWWQREQGVIDYAYKNNLLKKPVA